MPWDDLMIALGLKKVAPVFKWNPDLSPKPVQKMPAPEKYVPTPEEALATEEFVENFIKNNDSLTPQAKELMTGVARSRRGEWVLKDHVIGVTQSDNKITVKSKGGEGYFYIRDNKI